MDHSGTYPITIIAKDDSGNVRRKKLTVYVSEGSRPIAEKDRKEETPQASVPDTKSKEQAPPRYRADTSHSGKGYREMRPIRNV